MASFSTVYTYTASFSDANENMAVNMAKQGFFNNLVANPPAGWTLTSSSIPTPNTTNTLAYYAEFDVYGEFRVRISGGTATNFKYFILTIYTPSGTILAAGASYATMMSSVGSFNYTVNVSIQTAAIASTYRVYKINVANFGKINIETIYASTVAVFNSLTTVYTIAALDGTSLVLIAPSSSTIKDGAYLIFDGHVKSNNIYYGKLKNVKVTAEASSPSNINTDYYIDGEIYSCLGKSAMFYLL